jgi:hypothetical protein
VDDPEKTAKSIQHFASIEEMAEFWDTHDSSESEHEFKPVEFTAANALKQTWMLSIRLDKVTSDALKEIAKPKGLGASTLVRVRKDEGEAR